MEINSLTKELLIILQECNSPYIDNLACVLLQFFNGIQTVLGFKDLLNLVRRVISRLNNFD